MSTDNISSLPFGRQMGVNLDSLGTQPTNKQISDAIPQFQDALTQAVDETQPTRVAQLDNTPAVPSSTAPTETGIDSLQFNAPVAATPETSSTDDRARAAEGLGFNPSGETEVSTPGGTILNGLEQLRSVFDTQIGSFGDRVEGVRMDVSDMMILQAEVIKYTMLVDVTSKLAGKSTQAMDTLMKGQ